MSDATSLSRRAVYSALAVHITDIDRLMKAMWLWQDNYSQSSRYEVSRFVEALCNTLVSKDDFHQLVAEIQKYQLIDAKKLRDDPIDQMQKFRTNGDKPDQKFLQIPRTFAVLIAQLTREVDAADRASLSNEIKLTLDEAEMPN